MKRNEKQLFVRSKRGEFSSDDGDLTSEIDEDFQNISSDDEVFNVNSASRSTTSKRIDNNNKKENGKFVRNHANSVGTNRAKRPQSEQKKDEPLAKKKKTSRNAHSVNHESSDEMQFQRKESRERTKTKRFGTRESTIDFNDFFTTLASQKSADQLDASTSRNAGETTIVPAENSIAAEHSSLILKFSDEMKSIEAKFDAKLSVLVKQCARIEAILKFKRNTIEMPSNSADGEDPITKGDETEIQLKQMGLPTSEIEKLERIEENLNTTSFETEMV